MNKEHSNRLIHEKSPYLLQHAHNPVDWYPWNSEAFEKSKKEDKPIFLSIGYSTCHWCHVMERESFENAAIAKLMNEHFVPIKVDREERPDVDHVYMNAVTAMTGQGGWPLSVFLTPDKKPFFGGTYFPPEARWGAPGFADLLRSVHEAWTTRKDQLLTSSESLAAAMKEFATTKGISPLDEQTLYAGYKQLEVNFDKRYGGFGSQPKFPSSHTLSFLLHHWKRTGQVIALEMVEKTLTEMAKGGMYDQLGGGFHRYSTDFQWRVPHFEKMLYDQAMLSRTYLEAYQATGKPFYARIAHEILDYVLRDMQYGDGGFYSAEDADSVPPEAASNTAEKKEGAFYVWSKSEIASLLESQEADIFNYYYGVEEHGNAIADPHGEFTGKNVLYVAQELSDTAQHFKISESEVEKLLQSVSQKILTARNKRPRPYLDDKILVDWNGLMISSLAYGARVLGEPRYREAAVKAAGFILKNLMRNGKLLHRYRDGEAAIEATLTDYSFFIHGLLDLYEATFDIEYLTTARNLGERMLASFWDEEQGGFFLTAHDAEELFLRQKDIYDGAFPSGNSIAALDLLRLAHITSENAWQVRAETLLKTFSGDISRQSSAFAQMLIALDFLLGPAREIVLSADGPKDVESMVKVIFSRFEPRTVVLFRPSSGKDTQELFKLAPFLKEQVPLKGAATAYVCENHTCQLPVTDVKALEKLLAHNPPSSST